MLSPEAELATRNSGSARQRPTSFGSIAVASKPDRLRPSILANATACSSKFLAFDYCCSARLLTPLRMPGSSPLTGALISQPNYDKSFFSKLPSGSPADRIAHQAVAVDWRDSVGASTLAVAGVEAASLSI